MDVFEVGEIALLKNLTGDFAQYNGTECQIVGGYARRLAYDRFGTVAYHHGYEIISVISPQRMYASTESLRKKPEPPSEDQTERNSLVPWRFCGWIPACLRKPNNG